MHGIIKDNVFWKKEKERDRLRMGGGSWSINLAEVDLNKVTTIVFCTEKAHYTISAIDAKLHGFERILGDEPKLVVPVQYWKEKLKSDSPRKA